MSFSGSIGYYFPVSTARTMPSKKTVRIGDKAKLPGTQEPPAALLFELSSSGCVRFDVDQRRRLQWN
jgi:hypothetical protein